MDKKVKEIEWANEMATGIVAEYMKLLRPFLDEIKRLNSLLSLKDEKIDELDILQRKTEEEHDTLWARIRELEMQLSELRNAIDSAQEDNIDEVHCSCVPLLKAHIKELEEKLVTSEFLHKLDHSLATTWRDKNMELENRVEELKAKLSILTYDCP